MKAAPASNKNDEIDSEMIWQEQIKRKAKDMKLFSIMQSEVGVCCMIDNKILYEGDLINDFTVKKISDSLVALDLEGVEIVLKLSQ